MPLRVDRRSKETQSAIDGIVSLLSARGVHNLGHTARLESLAMHVSARVFVADHVRSAVSLLTLLKDAGKLALSDDVLHATGELTPEQRIELCRHPEHAARMVGELPGLAELGPLLLAQSERWDGLGYPLGIGGNDIPLACRVVFVCDAYVAMTRDRPYRPAIDPEIAAKAIAENAGTQFCPTAARGLLGVLEDHHEIGRAPDTPDAPGPTALPETHPEDVTAKWAALGLLGPEAQEGSQAIVEDPPAVDVTHREMLASPPVAADVPAAPELMLPEKVAAEWARLGLMDDGHVDPPAVPLAVVPDTPPAPGFAPPAPAAAVEHHAPRQWVRRGRTRVSRWWDMIAFAAGLGIGLMWGLPVANVDHRCPPKSEGLDYCVLQKAWGPVVTKVAAAVVLAYIIGQLIQRFPAISHAASSGTLLPRKQANPNFSADPTLVAANWGLTYNDARPDRLVGRGRRWRDTAAPSHRVTRARA
ncbi:MAG: HD-GYP domain-containing protein [Solirubrobacteraceae bacterium]